MAGSGGGFWGVFSGWVASGLNTIGMQNWLESVKPRWIADALQAVARLFLLVPLVFITALLLIVFFALPALN